MHGCNTTVNVDKIRGFRPLYVWLKTFVFAYSLAVYQRFVVFCTHTAGTPSRTTCVLLPSLFQRSPIARKMGERLGGVLQKLHATTPAIAMDDHSAQFARPP